MLKAISTFMQGTMQAITDVVEGWVREYPDQIGGA